MPAGPKKTAPKFVVPVPPPRKPLWDGPSAPGRNGGITFSMLRRWLECRERFRVRYVLGFQAVDKFQRAVEYGQMWHVCEEALAGHKLGLCPTCDGDWTAEKAAKLDEAPPPAPCPNCEGRPDNPAVDWKTRLGDYTESLLRRYPLQRADVSHWANVCAVQFPIYVDYWSKQPDVLKRTPLLQEQSFDVPYKLPSGRVVRLRGKWDAVDLIGEGADAGVYLQENKTKGDIDEQQLVRQLTMDLQTMIYLVALDVENRNHQLLNGEGGKRSPIRGVRYNVVRRPLSGGRGTIVQRKGTKNIPAETAEDYYARLRGIIDGSAEDAPGPSYFFHRWKVEVTPSHVDRFRRQVLDPILEQLCDWYDCVRATGDQPFDQLTVFGPGIGHPSRGLHYRTPYGVGGPLDDYGSEFDAYLDTGSEVGLTRRETLFEELT